MSENTFESSDSARSGQPLRHVQTAWFEGPFVLELGGTLPGVTVAYETYGQLSPTRDNAVLICHALSGDSHVARHNDTDDPGWWEVLVGPGKPVDTDRFFVICPNLLGGCRGTTGPGSLNPATRKPYGRDFPVVTIADMVEVQRKLVDHLGIAKLLAVVGGSLGGHQALTWATRFPERLHGVAPVATSPRLTSQALAFDVVGRNAIRRDPNYCDGQYYGAQCTPEAGLAIARMIGHITYLSQEAMTRKFDPDRLHPRNVATDFEKIFSVGSYLGYQGDKFVERFDANSYITISMAMDLFDLGATPAELAARLRPAACRWLVLSFSSDWLFPSEQGRAITNALLANRASVSYCNVTSSCGHDAFLLPDDFPIYGEMIRAFLENLHRSVAFGVHPLGGSGSGDTLKRELQTHGGLTPPGPQTEPGGAVASVDGLGQDPNSIFEQHRLDYDRLVELIPEGASVLDLGCGSGSLLARLRTADLPERRLVGIELDELRVLAGVRRGLDIIHADLNRGLGAFANQEFDFVALSQTLQTVSDVEGVISEMLRVGRTCVVSFPNFAYHRLQRMLAEEGRAPKSSGVLHHEWYNTPNLRFFTMADFDDFCLQKQIRVHRRIGLDTEANVEVLADPNRNADLAIFVISRPLDPEAASALSVAAVGFGEGI